MTSPKILEVRRKNYGFSFKVEGETGTYDVEYKENKGWFCTCPHHHFRKAYCKHIQLCRAYVNFRFGIDLPDELYCNHPRSINNFIFDSSEVITCARKLKSHSH